MLTASPLQRSFVCLTPNLVTSVISLTRVHAALFPWEERYLLLGALVVMGIMLHAEHRSRRGCERLSAAVLSSLSGYVAILDRQGIILGINRAWDVLEASHPLAKLGIGDEWLAGQPFGEVVATRVGLVLSGERRYVRMQVVAGAAPEQFLELRVRRLPWLEGGAVLSFTDIGKRRRAEHDARRARSLLAHMDRLGVLMELTSTLAHELNQPLAAIHTNARAAQALLDRTRPDISEGLAALADIRADSKRASEVILRMRKMLERGEPRMVVERLEAIVQEAVTLVEREALDRGVSLVYDLDGESLPVLVDPVQIQQIILNLLINAFDAVAVRPRGERCVELCLRVLASGAAELAIRDSGIGLDPSLHERIFEHFFTTKAGGLGLGLAICRTIAEAHRGLLLVESTAGSGSTFRLRLPLHYSG